MLKTWITGCLICCACVTNGSAQNSRAIRIYGEVTTVMNRKICGYITWGKNLYWTDIFTAGKIGNPYMRYRDIMGDNVRFSDGRRDTPPEHEFSCRFGNIRSIRVIGDRRIELGVKGGNVTELERGRLPSVTGLPWNCGMERRKAWYGTISAKSFSLPHLTRSPSRKIVPLRVSWRHLTGCTRGLSNGIWTRIH